MRFTSNFLSFDGSHMDCHAIYVKPFCKLKYPTITVPLKWQSFHSIASFCSAFDYVLLISFPMIEKKNYFVLQHHCIPVLISLECF